MTALLPYSGIMAGSITDREVWRVPVASDRLGSEALSEGGRPSQELRITIENESEIPVWLEPTARKLVELLKLESGWDSYSAKPISPHHVEGMFELLCEILEAHTPPPSVVPTTRGGIQVEWHRNGADLEIETLSRYRFQVSFEDRTSREEWEKELSIDDDLRFFRPIIQRIS